MVLLMASFTNTVAGFGFAMVSLPLIAMLLGPKAAIVYCNVAASYTRFFLMWNTRKDYDWRVVLPAIFGTALGIIPAAYVLMYIDIPSLNILMGLALLAALFLLGKEYRFKTKHIMEGRIAAGWLCGFFTTATSIGGPPLVLWFLNEGFDKKQLRANLIWIFAFSTTLSIGGNFASGIAADIGSYFYYLYGIPGVFIGWGLGLRFFDKINQKLFNRFVKLVICIGCITALYNGVSAKFF